MTYHFGKTSQTESVYSDAQKCERVWQKCDVKKDTWHILSRTHSDYCQSKILDVYCGITYQPVPGEVITLCPFKNFSYNLKRR